MAARPAAGPGGAAAVGADGSGSRVEFAMIVRGTEDTAYWLADLLRGERLLVETVSVRRNSQWLLLVRLKPEDAPAIAEKVGVFKMHRTGSEKPFVLAHWRDFGRGEEARPEELFSLAERQEIVQNVIDSIRAEQLTEVVGLEQRCVLVHPGQSVFAVCQRAGILTALFPPHDYELLSAIRRQWLSHLTIPVHMIKVYFGIRIAFYYAFLSFYTWSLMVPMTVGVLVMVHRDSLTWRISGVFFNLLWNTVILEVWRKRADHLSCFWGLHEHVAPLKNRLLFAYGENMLAQRAFRMLISQVVVLFCVLLCVLQQYQYLTFEAFVTGAFPSSALCDVVARVVPGVMNTLVGMAFSDVYRAISQRMTEWENHQTQAEYLQHLTYKLIVFDFFGRFGSLFYTAFYLQDIQLLRKQVYIQLLLSFTKDNLVETVMPRAVRHFSSLVRHMMRRESTYLPGVHSILSEADMVRYTSTYVDYYKMFSQFAFVFLFGPVVPLAPLIAFFGNLMEMLIVGYKLTVVFQRPLKIGHEGIGIWEPAFRAIGFLAVPSNIALICVENPDSLSALSRLFTDMEFVLFLVGIEHVVLLLKLTLQYALRSEVHCPHYSPVLAA
ncbi:anoctamin-10-like [Dermacentor albipictus]|uniref:anoctamin-10-like n=1 Tax=Dermacentor albipictus TaxID=60249 RepID=UPI0038FC6975